MVVGTPAHEASKTYRYMQARQEQHAATSRGAAALRKRFTAYDELLCQVQTFKYLGRIIAYNNSKVPVARWQLKRAHGV